jgi:hypothetical protein
VGRTVKLTLAFMAGFAAGVSAFPLLEELARAIEWREWS